MGGLDGCIQSTQVHVGGNYKGQPLIDGIPGGHVQGRRLVFLFQRSLGQAGAVVGLGHELKLHRSGVVAGEKMDRKLNALVRSPVRYQFGVGLGVGLQFGQDIPVALASENKSTFCPREPGGLVGECSQFIRQGQLADFWADIVDSAEQISQVRDSRYPSAAPWV